MHFGIQMLRYGLLRVRTFLAWQTEATTLEALTQKLRILIPELLQLNHVIPDDQASTIAIELTSHRQELIQVAA